VASTSAPTVPGRVAAIEECVTLLRAIRDPLARDLYVDKLAQLLKVDLGLVQRALRSAVQHAPAKPRDVAPAPVAAEPIREAVQRRISLTSYKLLAFLTQHPTFWPRVDASLLKDDAVRTLVASAQERNAFDAPSLLAAAPAEIRDAVAKALGSEEFAGDPEPQRAFESIITTIGFPSDLETLMQERSAAIARGDRDLTEKLNARIIAVRRSSR
jgi:DNA primase